MSEPVSGSPRGEIDLGELLGTLARERWLLLGVLAATLAVGALYCLLAAPVFRADALVQVETDQKSVNALLGDVAELLGAQAPVAAEIEILRSRKVLGAAIDRLGLERVAEPRRLPLIGDALARWTGADQSLALATLEVPTPWLEQWLTLRVTGAGYELFGEDGELLLSGVAGQASRAAAPGGAVSILVDELRGAPGTEFRLMRRDRDELFEALGERLEVAERGKQSGIIGLAFEDGDRLRAAAFVNALLEAYVAQNVERRSAEAAQTLAFLEQQLPRVRERLEAAEAALNAFRLKQGSADLAKETELVLQQSVALETQRVQAQQQREALLQSFTPSHPTLRALDAQLRQIEREQAGLTSLVRQLPATQQDLLRLARDVQVNTDIYTLLLNSSQELQLARAGTVGNVRVIDEARPRLQPAHPLPGLVMPLCAVLGLALGVLGAFARRSLRHGVEDSAVVERLLGLPTYAVVPYARAQRKLARAAARGALPLLAQADPGDPAIEALRSLRTSLHFASFESRSNVLVLTGPTPELGKSFLAVNFAAVLANARKNVVVVDADLRKGRLHEHFGGLRTPGLTDYLAGDAALDQVARRTALPGLHVVPTGTLPPNPAELLMHERFAALLAELSRRYDHVIVDTPPVLAVTDATLIGRLAGSTLLVLKAGEHSLRAIEDSVRRLRQAGVELRGTIFNQVGLREMPYGYGDAYEYRTEALRKSA